MSVIEGWLKEVHEEKGSDLFVTADAPPCIKVNGKIRAISTEVLLQDEVSELVKSIMTKKQIREFDETMECQFAISSLYDGSLCGKWYPCYCFRQTKPKWTLY